VRDLRAPLDDIPLVPTGGISATEAGEYVAAGAVAVGAGGQLIGDALKPDGDLDALRERCCAFLEAVRSARAAR
jgi:2-dehydro-3-deoxyphosphogluconate aldolase/(4S)-4-hydroxy-2-oxoglutarate aldolase